MHASSQTCARVIAIAVVFETLRQGILACRRTGGLWFDRFAMPFEPLLTLARRVLDRMPIHTTGIRRPLSTVSLL
jgi:hypothetical protein